jgi:uncharacterized protein (TIGR01777 family)
MNVTVAGATGLIGRALCKALVEQGHSVTALVRNSARAADLLPIAGLKQVEWDPGIAGAWEEAAGRADAVINLSGESIAARRWSAAYKQRLRSSRLDSTRALVRARADCGTTGGVFINASAVGYYGDRGDAVLNEDAPPGDDFLARLCVDWEGEALACRELETRVVLLRLAMVLARGGGAIEKMAKPYRWFLGGPLGRGRQWTAWIHLSDVVGMVLWALSNPSVDGPINVCSPNPVRMRDFATSLGIVLRRPALFPVPAPVLRVVVGEMADSLLASQRVAPRAASEGGYQWHYPLLEPALHSVLG